MYVRDYHYDALVALPWIQDGVSAYTSLTPVSEPDAFARAFHIDRVFAGVYKHAQSILELC